MLLCLPDSSKQLLETNSSSALRKWNSPIAGKQIVVDFIKSKDAISHSNFDSLVKTCTAVEDLSLAKQLHTNIRSCKVELNTFQWNNLINMYSKCGSLDDAPRVFHEMQKGHVKANVFTWTI